MPEETKPNDEMLHKAMSTDVEVDEDERAVAGVICSLALDRDGEVVMPDGVDMTEFEKNPVVMFNHSYFNGPVGKCVGCTRDRKKIVAKTVFAKRPEGHPANLEWFPDTLLSLYKQGIMKGFSIGFKVVEGRAANDADVAKWGPGCRRVFSKIKVFEYSCVPIPANQDALAKAVHKGQLSADLCKKLFDVEVKAEEPAPTPPAKPEEPPAAPPPPARKTVHIIDVIPAAKTPGPGKTVVEDAIEFAKARKKGYIYIR